LQFLAAVIGFMQWRTAHQRSVLDLFEKRFEVYSSIREIVGEVIREGSVPNLRAFNFARAAEKAQFLFGSEAVREAVLAGGKQHHVMGGGPPVQAVEAEAARTIHARLYPHPDKGEAEAKAWRRNYPKAASDRLIATERVGERDLVWLITPK
jgi:hypothetical protein